MDHGIPPSLPEAITPHSADSLPPDSNFDAYGEPHHRDTHTLNSSFCALPSLPPGEPLTHVHMHETKPSPNLRLDPPQGEDQPHDLTSDVFVYGRPNLDEFDNTPPMPTINFVDLLGSTFLLNGERDQLDVTDHKGPYTSPDTTYNGSSYNLLIEWETGEQTWETKDNNKWKEATVYDKKYITNAPKGHKKTRVHFVLDVKYCGKFKARLVADGHFTKELMETVYSGIFLAQPNNLELWGADAGHAYNPQCWHHTFYEILHKMGFKPSTTDSDTWMKYSKDGSHHEYIAVYVDDLAIYMEDVKTIL